MIHILLKCSVLFVLFIGIVTCSTGGAYKIPNKNPFEALSVSRLGDLKTISQSKITHIYFSANVNGETDPCGCAVNPKGGLDRRLNFIEEAKKDKTSFLVLDSGNAFFPSSKIDRHNEKQLMNKARNLAKGHKGLGIQAQNVGLLDLSMGLNLLIEITKESDLNLISTNLVDQTGQHIFKKSYEAKLENGQEIVVFGLSEGGFLSDEIKVLDPIKALSDELENVSNSKIVVVLSDMTNELEKELAKKAKRPLIILGGRDLAGTEIAQHIGQSIIASVQFQGQQWGGIELAWNHSGDHWVDVGRSAHFAKRWDDARVEYDELCNMKDSKGRKSELERVTDVFRALDAYAPKNQNRQIPYTYQVVDMSIRYLKRNKFSELMGR